MKTHPYPRLEWTPCSEPPSDIRRVVVWHRSRRCNRFFQITVGWWNTEEWRKESLNWHEGEIYQPTMWKDVEPPK
jgi:hypothetical protein